MPENFTTTYTIASSSSLCKQGADPSIERWFHDCVYTTRDYIGFYLGILSILSWMIAQIPQFITNYRRKSAEALSPFFLAEWLLGDTFNLVGALLKGNQPENVVLTAQYFILADCVLLVQYIYYTSAARRRERTYAYLTRRRRHHRHHHRHHHIQQRTTAQHPTADMLTDEYASVDGSTLAITDATVTQQSGSGGGGSGTSNASSRGKKAALLFAGLVSACFVVASHGQIQAASLGSDTLYYNRDTNMLRPSIEQRKSTRHSMLHSSSSSSSSVGSESALYYNRIEDKTTLPPIETLPPIKLLSWFSSSISSTTTTITSRDTPDMTSDTTSSPHTSNNINNLADTISASDTKSESSLSIQFEKPASSRQHTHKSKSTLWKDYIGTSLGYLSCMLYLTSRFSQIFKNYNRKSAEGLALSMFFCAITANLLYGSAVILRAHSWAAILSSLPWLIGSLGTVSLDAIILYQAITYDNVGSNARSRQEQQERVSGGQHDGLHAPLLSSNSSGASGGIRSDTLV